MSEHEINKLLRDKRKAEAKGNLQEVAQIHNVIGEIYSKLGQHEEAIEQHEMELHLSEALGDTVGVAVAHRKIGECHCELAEFDKALHHQKLHLSLAEKAGDDVEIQRAHATIGRTYLFQAEGLPGQQEHRVLMKAELYFWKSFEVCKRLESKVDRGELLAMKARLLLNLALVHDNRGESKKGFELIERAILLAEKGKLYEDLHRCHYTLSDMLERAGQLRRALCSIHTSITCAQKAKDKFAEWAAIEKQSKIYLQMKDFKASRRCLKKALKSRCPSEQDKSLLEDLLRKVRLLSHYDDKISNATEANDQSLILRFSEKMADLFVSIKLFKPALEYYHKMLDCAQALKKPAQDLIPVYVSLSQTYKDDKQYTKAIIYFRKEIECHGSNHSQVCKTLLNIAEAQELAGEDYNIIKDSYSEAVKEAAKAKDKKLQFLVLKSFSVVQKLFRDESLPSTEAQLQKMMASYGFTMDDEMSDIDSQEKEECDESDVSLEDFTDTDNSDDNDLEEFGKPSRDSASHVGQAKHSLSIKRNEKGETPLHRACIDGKLRTVKTLIDKGHPVNVRDFCGWLPLHEAANHGYVDIVAYLLDKGAWINDRGGEKCGGVTPLHDAAANGNLDVVKLLIERGANVHAKDDEGNTAVDSLRSYRESLGDDIGRTEMAELLSMEKYIKRTMQGNNPHLPSKESHLPDADIPELVSRRSRRTRRRASIQNDHLFDPEDNSDEGDGDNYSIPLLQVDLSDLDQLQNPSTARNAYREAITELGSAASKAAKGNPQVPNVSANQGPALISPDETGDDWLVEDIRPSAKRKHLDVDDVFKGTKVNKRTRLTNSAGHRCDKLTKAKIDRVWVEDGDEDEDEHLAYQQHRHLDTLDGVESPAEGAISDELMLGKTQPPTCSKRSTQLTLTQCSSISRSVQRSEHCPQYSQQVSQMDNTLVPSISTASAGNTNAATVILRFRVKIKDVTLLVPIQKNNNEPTILELAKAASERYYKMFSLRPVLSLAKDGAILSPDEPIGLVLSNNEEVEGIIESWDLPALTIRYLDACKSLKTTVYRNIQTALSNCETSQILTLTGLSLRPAQFLSVARALQCQVLKELNLEGNKLTDVGMQHLAKVLHTLSGLTVLNLSSNNITSSSLATLMECLTTPQGSTWQKPLQCLEELNLSQNPLGDNSVSYLISIISHLARLSTLKLAACQLSVRFFQDQRINLMEEMKASRLRSLDVSYNSLGCTGIELLLMCVNEMRLLSLDISGTLQKQASNTVCKHLHRYLLKTECALKQLSLDSCFLCVDHISDICSFIRQSNSLEVISLSNHRKLSLVDLQEIIAASAESSLRSITMTGCGFGPSLSTEFVDAISTKQYAASPLTYVRFQLSCAPNDVDRASLEQIWIDRWPESGKCDFVGGRVTLSVDGH